MEDPVHTQHAANPVHRQSTAASPKPGWLEPTDYAILAGFACGFLLDSFVTGTPVLGFLSSAAVGLGFLDQPRLLRRPFVVRNTTTRSSQGARLPHHGKGVQVPSVVARRIRQCRVVGRAGLATAVAIAVVAILSIIVRSDNAHGIVTAIQRYHHDRGHYPESLDQLTPDYLTKIPDTGWAMAEPGFRYYRLGETPVLSWPSISIIKTQQHYFPPTNRGAPRKDVWSDPDVEKSE